MTKTKPHCPVDHTDQNGGVKPKSRSNQEKSVGLLTHMQINPKKVLEKIQIKDGPRRLTRTTPSFIPTNQ